ncbi:RNA-binding protein 48 [Lucilia cuprina]|nr:RNA-binding protein 48 [Lucilia cuprina]
MNFNAEHHIQYDYCKTRLKYRQGRQLKAVKQELKQRLQRFGKLYYVRNVTTEMLERQLELEQFTEVYLAKFYKIYEARKCKRFLDAKEFYGGILHISYAPEYESKEELKDKIQKRKLEIENSLKRINLHKNNEKKMQKN